jgi:hypothetical protein
MLASLPENQSDPFLASNPASILASAEADRFNMKRLWPARTIQPACPAAAIPSLRIEVRPVASRLPAVHVQKAAELVVLLSRPYRDELVANAFRPARGPVPMDNVALASRVREFDDFRVPSCDI